MNTSQLFLGSIWNRKKEDQCCIECPPISADVGNIIECHTDGIYAHISESTTTANEGLSVFGSNVQLGQEVGAVGNPALISEDREIPFDIVDGKSIQLTYTGTTVKTTLRPDAILIHGNDSETGPLFDVFNVDLATRFLMTIDVANTVFVQGFTNLALDGKVYIGDDATGSKQATATLELKGGSTTLAPLKLNTGSVLTTPENGAVEFDGTHFYGTVGSTRYQLDQQTGTQGLDSVLAQNQALTANRINSLGGHNLQFVNGHIGIQITPTAHLHLASSSVTAGNAPLKFANSPLLTTAETGSVEYNGTNLFFTRTGTTRETVFTGVSGATAPTTTSGGTITNRYGGDTNFLGDPNSWASVVIAGTTYKIPLYT